jgi:hypothetical protein
MRYDHGSAVVSLLVRFWTKVTDDTRRIFMPGCGSIVYLVMCGVRV